MRQVPPLCGLSRCGRPALATSSNTAFRVLIQMLHRRLGRRASSSLAWAWQSAIKNYVGQTQTKFQYHSERAFNVLLIYKLSMCGCANIFPKVLDGEVEMDKSEWTANGEYMAQLVQDLRKQVDEVKKGTSLHSVF